MEITITQLRQNIYKILDQLIETGEPIQINRNGHRIKISREAKGSKLKNLKPHKVYGPNTKPEDIQSIEWSHTWKEDYI